MDSAHRLACTASLDCDDAEDDSASDDVSSLGAAGGDRGEDGERSTWVCERGGPRVVQGWSRVEVG